MLHLSELVRNQSGAGMLGCTTFSPGRVGPAAALPHSRRNGDTIEDAVYLRAQSRSLRLIRKLYIHRLATATCVTRLSPSY